MKAYLAALWLPLLFGAVGAARATTATIDFNTASNTTANTMLITNGPDGKVTMLNVGGMLITNGPDGKVTMLNVGGRNAVQTGGTSDNEFLYVSLPKGLFKSSKSLWATVEYFDQGAGQFQFHYDENGTDITVGEVAITEHNTKAWLTHTCSLPRVDFEEMGPGGADIWIDDLADGPEVIDKIVVTDQDPTLVSWPHTDPAHPVTIDGKIEPGEWDNAYSFTVNTAAQDALAGVDWSGPQDFSGTYYLQWDEKGVYIRGDVTDATPRLNDAGGSPPNYWNGDGFQIYLALDWTDPTRSSYLDSDYDVYVGLGDGTNGSMPPSWAVQVGGSSGTIIDWSSNGARPIPAANLAVNNTINPQGYQFEFFLPWDMLLASDSNTTSKVTAGQQIGWFFFGNNSTVIGTSAQQVAMSPFGRTHPSITPSSWTSAVLAPFQALPATNPSGSTAGGTSGSGTTGQ